MVTLTGIRRQPPYLTYSMPASRIEMVMLPSLMLGDLYVERKKVYDQGSRQPRMFPNLTCLFEYPRMFSNLTRVLETK